MPNPPSAAQSLYSHLKAGTPERRSERNRSVAEAMFPNLAPAPKPKPPEHPLLPRLKRAGEL
jgi:hypothetical protein